MFRSNSTFVIGAGASCELDLPSGDSLKDQIISRLTTTHDHSLIFADKLMYGGLRQYLLSKVDNSRVRSEIRTAAEKISAGLPLSPSIDNFLHVHQGDVYLERLGKAAIAACILHAERRSRLFEKPSFYSDDHRPVEPTISRKELSETWYFPFAQTLMSGIQPADLNSYLQRLRFVIFNYDRCFEQFLWMALQAHYAITPDEAARLLSNVSFYHPYGSLGPLPWQSDGSVNSTPLGGGSDANNVFALSEQIKTFTESVESETAEEIRQVMFDADMIIFLGFGYLRQNIELLNCDTYKAQKVFGTAYGIKATDISVVENILCDFAASGYQSSVRVEAGKCRDLFDNFRLQLTHS